MSTFFNLEGFYLTLSRLFRAFPIFWYSLISFGVLLFVLFIVFLVRLFCKKARYLSSTPWFVASLLYFFTDILFCISVTPFKVWQEVQITLYSYCLLKFAVLVVAYALICLQKSIQLLRDNKKQAKNCDKNKSSLPIKPTHTVQENQELQSALCSKLSYFANKPLNPCAKINESVVSSSGVPVQNRETARALDLNVGYCLNLVNSLEQKCVSTDEGEFLQDLKLKLRQAYCYLPEQIRSLNKDLEVLIKLMAKYGVVA